MATCNNGKCGRDQVEGHDFCPNCGIDNRSIERQWPVPAHPHLFPDFSKFCVRCGIDKQLEEDRLSNLKKSKVFLGTGVSLLLVAIICTILAQAIDNKNYADFEAVVLKAKAEKKKLDPINGPHFHPSPIGNFVYLFGLIGAGVSIFGGFLFVNNRIPLSTEVGSYEALL